MDEFDGYAVDIDSECYYQDFDSVDLYGEKTIEDTNNDFGNDLQFE